MTETIVAAIMGAIIGVALGAALTVIAVEIRCHDYGQYVTDEWVLTCKPREE